MRCHIAPVFATVASLVLTACGGGGSDSSQAGSPPAGANPNAYPSVAPFKGDYFVYTSTTTPTLPTGQAPAQRTVSRDVQSVSADGAFVRLDTFSAVSPSTIRNYAADGNETSRITTASRCDFTPGYRNTPPRGSVVGDKFTSSSKQTCTAQPGGGVTSVELVESGTVLAAESRTVAVGTFDTIKFEHTTTSTSATGVTTTLETCWVDKLSGRAVECTSTFSTTPSGQTTPTSAGTTAFVLTTYSFNGAAPVGPAERRFAGAWSVSFAGSSGGSCATLLVDGSGNASGTCQFTGSAGASTPFAVTGTVKANGAAAVAAGTASTGASLVGTFSSPSTANGTWVNGSLSGTWTATHQ